MKEIVIIRHFGAKNYTAGVFYDGLLKYEIDDRFEFPEKGSDIFQMMEDLAQLAKVTIKYEEADISFALFSYVDIPEKLQEYYDIVIKFHKTQTFETFIQYNVDTQSIPHVDYDVDYRVKTVYMGSGGDIEQFAAWYQAKEFLSKTQYDDLRDAMTTNREVYNQMLDKFQPLWKEFLENIWNAPKPLTLLAEQAKKSQTAQNKKP